MGYCVQHGEREFVSRINITPTVTQYRWVAKPEKAIIYDQYEDAALLLQLAESAKPGYIREVSENGSLVDPDAPFPPTKSIKVGKSTAKPTWHDIKVLKPPRDKHPYYGDRYSVVVQLQCVRGVCRWDFSSIGWVDAHWSEGSDPRHYEHLDGLTIWRPWSDA